MPRRGGFSLLEVMVVVAIIALVMAVLLPSLRKVRQQTRSVACQSNLRQIAQGWNLYLQQSMGRFPLGVNLDITFGGIQGSTRPFGDPRRRQPVSRPLNRQLGMDTILYSGGEVFQCPDDKGSDTIRPSYFVSRGNSYRANPMMIGQDRLFCPADDPCQGVCEQISDLLASLRESDVQHDPSKLLLVGDFEWYATWQYNAGTCMDLHGRMQYANMAFLDGHVDSVRIAKGMWITGKYSVVPYRDLYREATNKQLEVPCE